MAKAWAEGNVNDLCSLAYRDYLSGFAVIKAIPCRLEKLPEEDGSQPGSLQE